VTFWEHFLRLIGRRPIPAVAALYWHLTRRKVRARNRLRLASADLSFPYRVWMDRTEKQSEPGEGCLEAIDKWHWQPRFSVMLHGAEGCTPQERDRSVKSIERQIYPAWTLVDKPVRPIQKGLTSVEADFVVPLRVGDSLSRTALFRIAETLQDSRDAAILYGDQDQRDSRGRRRRPWFKPRWNEEMFLALDFLSGAAAIEQRLAERAAANARTVGELMVAAVFGAAGPIVHIPHILAHVAPGSPSESRRLAAVAEAVRPLGATCSPGPFGTVKVQWPLPEQLPLVSIIVPTRDKLNLVRPCLESVRANTDYGRFEIIVIDKGSVERRTADYFDELGRDPRVRVLPRPGPYNFSAINNFAAREARGSYLCLLNNDTEVIEPRWLTEMMRYAVRPDIGAVGAKLLYADGSLQHAGVVVGVGGVAGHIHRSLPAGEPGYFCQPHVAQFVSAVTAACLVVDKRKFLAVGGLDEIELPVAFNDVDLCLKLQAAGWRNIYVPHAVLLHHESKSREKDASPRQIARFRRETDVLQKRWGTQGYDDPLLNPNLDPFSETLVIKV
jgi:O-antigen biosynthesis protein